MDSGPHHLVQLSPPAERAHVLGLARHRLLLPEHVLHLHPGNRGDPRVLHPGRLQLRQAAVAGTQLPVLPKSGHDDAADGGHPDPHLPAVPGPEVAQHVHAHDRAVLVRRAGVLHLPAAAVLPGPACRTGRGCTHRRRQFAAHPVGHRRSAVAAGHRHSVDFLLPAALQRVSQSIAVPERSREVPDGPRHADVPGNLHQRLAAHDGGHGHFHSADHLSVPDGSTALHPRHSVDRPGWTIDRQLHQAER